MLTAHQQIMENVVEPQEITKQNKKTVENKRNQISKEKEMELLRQEINRKKEQEDLAKKKEEEENIAIYRAIEQEKRRLETLKINEDQLLMEFYNKCKQNVLQCDNCCICMEAPRNAAIAPCGHKFFCFDCATHHHQQNPDRGCPICRNDIVMVLKIFD